MNRPTAIVYVDGFNLYHQRLKHHPKTKWLDLRSLASALLPTHDIVRIRYFTAVVRPFLGSDPHAPIRQQTYLRLLREDGIDVHDNGQFRNDVRRMPTLPITVLPDGTLMEARVRKVEEKGSDVNLAAHMIYDAMKNPCDVSVLASNDSDYCTMLDLLTNGLNQRFGLFSTADSPAQKILEQKPLFIKTLRRHTLENYQFPDVYRRKNGKTLRRPDAWR